MSDRSYQYMMCRGAIYNALLNIMRCEKTNTRCFIRAILRTAIVALLAVTSLATADESYFVFSIPQQSADGALTALAEQTDITVVFDYDAISRYQANELKGSYKIRKAVEHLLAGTRLQFEFNRSGHLIVTQNDDSSGDFGMGILSKKKLLASTVAFFVGGVVLGLLRRSRLLEDKESGWVLEEIVVTAQKREQRLIDVPIAISVVSGKELAKQGIVDLTELSYQVAGLSSYENTIISQPITIRGVSNPEGVSPLVGVYLDEIAVNPISSTKVSPKIEFTDLKQIEILKGPQGTTFGQGSVSGVVRYITNEPRMNSFEGRIDGVVSSIEGGDTSESLTSVFNIPVIQDLFAVRVIATQRNSGGWIDQPEANRRDVNDGSVSDLRIRGRFEPSSKLSIDFTTIANSSDSGTSGNSSNTGNPKDDIIETVAIDDEFISMGIDADYKLYNITINYDLNFAELVASASSMSTDNLQDTGYSKASLVNPVTGGELVVEDINTDNSNDASGDFYEVRLVSQDDSDLRWLAGFTYGESEFEGVSNVLTSFVDGIETPSVLTSVSSTSSSDSKAFFVDVAYMITPRFEVGVGVRKYEDDKELTNHLAFIFGDIDDQRKGGFDNTSGKLSAKYSLNDNANIYFRIAEGFRSGGFNAGLDLEYDPEELLSYEVGVKLSGFENRFDLDVAIYKNDYKKYQTAGSFIGPGGFPLGGVLNIGDVEMLGVEIGAHMRVTDNLSLIFSGSYVDTEVVKLDFNTTTFREGDELSDVPKASYSISANYDFNWFFDAKGFINSSYNWKDSEVSYNYSPAFFKQRDESEELSFLNAKIGASWEDLSVALFVNNITGEDDALKATVSNIYPRPQPRTIGLSFGYQF